MMTDDDDDDNLNGTHFAAQVAASWALAPFQREVGRIPAGVSIFFVRRWDIPTWHDSWVWEKMLS